MKNLWLKWPPSRKQTAAILFVVFALGVISEWQLDWIQDVWQ